MLTDKVRDTILNNGLIKRGTHIVIGLSGGPDSVCLFHVLHQLKDELDLQLYAVHVNHGLRGDAAAEDQMYVEKLCEKYQTPCESFCFNVNRLALDWAMTAEEAGRKVRYDSFYQVAAKIPGRKKIAVAQNANDQAETVLMRILRGTGTDGLAGIEYERKGQGDIPVIRPLLDVTRKEIEAYCENEHLRPRIDATNLEPIYTRNKIRLELLPQLAAQFNPNIMEALNRLSRIAKEDKEYLLAEAERIVAPHRREQWEKSHSEVIKSFTIPISDLENLHGAVLNRVIMIILNEIGLTRDLSTVHLASAVQLIHGGKTSAETNFPGGYGMRIAYGNAEFIKKSGQNGTIYNQKPALALSQTQLEKEVIPRAKAAEITEKTLPFKTWFDYDEIKKTGCQPTLRYRQQGDRIRPSGMAGTKKLQDFFVDAKIRREQRDRIPLVCLGSEVIWIVGYRTSENYKVKDRTENILLLEYCEEL